MAKSQGRFLAELLGSDGKVEKAKSDAGIYAGANVTIAADGTLTTTTLPLAGGALTGAVTTTSTIDGRDVATDGTKLDGIEASADVTDTANVTAAGALMDSELTSIASVKALNQGVATGDSPTFVDVTATSLDISGNIDVDGTTNLDATNIVGALDVTGTAAMDGLTVDGTVNINDAVPILRLDSPAVAWSGGEDLGGIDWYTKDPSSIGPTVMARIYSESSGTNTLPQPNMIFQTSVSSGSLTDRMKIAPNGDISFYEDTGTTPKFFWDASAESLGIGTSTPNVVLHTVDASGTAVIALDDSRSNVGDTASVEFRHNGITGSIVKSSAIEDFSVAANRSSDLQFWTRNNGTQIQAATIDSSGNVGIGTDTPAAGLQVGKGLTNAGGPAAGASTASACFGNDGSDDNYGLVLGADGNGLGYISAQRTDGVATAYNLSIQPNGGNVGIGTTSPSEKLHVQGDGADILLTDAAGGQTAKLGSTGSNNGLLELNNSAHTGIVLLNSSGDSYLNGGNVGIGTSSPYGKLQIEGATTNWGSAPILVFASTSTANAAIRDWAIGPADSNYGDFHILQGASTGASPLSTASARLTISAAGNVGIGTDTPGRALHVKSSGGGPSVVFEGTDNGMVFQSHSSDANVVEMVGYKQTGSSYHDIHIRADVQGLTVKETTGNVGIGTADPNDILDIHKANSQLRLTDTDDSKFVQFSYSGGKLVTRNNSTNTTVNQVTLTEDGKFGIGTISPDTSLHITKNQSSANSSIKLENAAGGNDSSFSIDWQLASSGTSAQIKAVRTNSPGAGDTDLVFSTSTSGTSLAEQMRIDHEGNITAKKIDVIATGGRISAYVQDSFHIGSEKSANGRYSLSSTRTYVDGGSSNYQGYVFGNENWFPQCFIPYSPHQVYRISASIYQLTGSTTSGGASARHYLGLAGYDENFNFLSVDAIGTYQYVLASNSTVNTGDTLEVDITMKGWNASGAGNGNKMDQGTVYIRPLWLANYQGAGGTAVLTGFNIQPAGTVADNDSNAGTNY